MTHMHTKTRTAAKMALPMGQFLSLGHSTWQLPSGGADNGSNFTILPLTEHTLTSSQNQTQKSVHLFRCRNHPDESVDADFIDFRTVAQNFGHFPHFIGTQHVQDVHLWRGCTGTTRCSSWTRKDLHWSIHNSNRSILYTMGTGLSYLHTKQQV